jgi:hypothetical protein
MKTLLAVIVVPLAILNVLGGIVSGIWLAVLGEWGIIGIGVLLAVGDAVFLGIALIPGLLLAAPAAHFVNEGRTVPAVFFVGLSSAYTLGLITAWCCGILFLCVRDATTSDIVPRLIWSYGVAIGPWAYMASKEQGPGAEGFSSTVSLFFAQLAYVAIIFLVLFSPISRIGAVKVFGGFMAVGLIAQIVFAVLFLEEQKRLAGPSGALY